MHTTPRDDDQPAFEPMRRHINRTDATDETRKRGDKPRNKRPWRRHRRRSNEFHNH